MQPAVFPILLFVLLAAALALTLLVAAWTIGPKRTSAVKQMPYESGMDPIHDTRRRFDVRFHLVAIAFLLFDVELLFLYPWAAATRPAVEPAMETNVPQGIDLAVSQHWVSSRDLVFGEAMLFVALLAVGFAYAWRKGVFRWR